MKRVIIIVGAIIVLGAAGWWGYRAYQQQQAAAQQASLDAAAQAQAVAELEKVIWASGKLQPLRWAGLSPAVAGRVSAIHVAEGEWVETGQLLLEVENSVLQSEVAVAAAALSEAEAARDKLLAGATEYEISRAQAQVDAAQANVALAAGQMLDAQAAIDQANAQVNITQRQYAELAAPPTAAELQIAKAQIAVAEAAVKQAQAGYNLVRNDPEISARPESMHLYQSTASLELAQAQAALTNQGATLQQLAVLGAQINAAKVQANGAKNKGISAEAGVKAALAQLAVAQANHAALLAGATPEDIAIAQARVQAAQAGLATAQAALQQTQIVAPFAGQVGTLNVRLGEAATPAQYALLLGDTKQMCIQTTDLRETDVVRLRPDATVEVTFDALPGQTFQGKIVKIAPVSTTEKGSTNYTVELTVDRLDERLRWGMTAFVNIHAP
jgi:multidrug efflux pump subunit AcrA (membrane-fusion protein)